MYIEEKKLKDFIADSGLVSMSDIDVAEGESFRKGSSVGDVLVEMGKITSDDLLRMEAYVLGIPFVDLQGKSIDFSVLSMIPEPIARKHNVIAFSNSDNGLEVAMLNTDDLKVIDFVKKKVGSKILPRLTNRESVKFALRQYQKSLKAEFGDIIQKETISLRPVADGEEGDLDETALKKMAEDVPVIRIVDALLKHAILQSASDIHIEPMEKEVVVRYRIDGMLHDAMVLPRTTSSSIIARIKVLANLRLDEKRLPQDGRFRVETDTEKVSFRVSILPIYFGEKAVMRLLRENAAGLSLESLGFHGEALERIHAATKLKTGMVLTTGPTGSGKTTTLYTVLDLVNTLEVNISTVEDPIEYQMPRINQTQVRPDIGFSFANGLRSLLRQDPDIVMVGEIRDNETASLAVNASLTGHLVLSTLHTNSAAGAIPRLMDMKVEPFLLVSVLNVIIGQRLVRKLCAEKEKRFLNKSELDKLASLVDLDRVMASLVEENIIKKGAEWQKIPFYSPKKNDRSESGYSGRVGIYEVLKVTPTIRNLIMKGAATSEIDEQSKKEGMLSMLEDGIFKAVSGVTTIEEVLRVVTE